MAVTSAVEEEISVAAAFRTLVLAVLALLVAAVPAGAQSGVGQAASALKSNPVYVDPSAELANQVDADALEARIKSAGAAPLFIAVLPQSAQVNSAGRTLVALRQAVGRKGTYALALGNEFRTLGDGFNAAARAPAPAARTATTCRPRSSRSSTPPARRRRTPARAAARSARSSSCWC